MKFLLLLLSIYLLVLGCLPCADSNDINATNLITVAAVPSAKDQCYHEENCTPLCICNCCGNYITAATAIIFSIKLLQKEIAKKPATHPYQPLLAIAGNSIWQPPRAR